MVWKNVEPIWGANVMKTKILTLILALFTMFAHGGGVELAWYPSCDTSIIGYKIYYGVVTNTVPSMGTMFLYCNSNTEVMSHYGATFSNVIVTYNTTNVVISNLVGGVTYVFAATAFNPDTESDFSSEVIYTPPLDLNTNAGSWGGITNWPVYRAGGARPILSFAPYAYDVHWIVPPQVVTNCKSFFITNNTVITETTNCWVSTNYSTSTIRNYLLKSDMVIPTNWTVQATADLRTWTNCFTGSNSPVYNTVINQGGNKFFRLKF
jgi:hypothetical protein